MSHCSDHRHLMRLSSCKHCITWRQSRRTRWPIGNTAPMLQLFVDVNAQMQIYMHASFRCTPLAGWQHHRRSCPPYRDGPCPHCAAVVAPRAIALAVAHCQTAYCTSTATLLVQSRRLRHSGMIAAGIMHGLRLGREDGLLCW